MKIIMIGHGMVGHKFIESVLELAGDEVEILGLTEERRKELYKESRNSTTVVKGKKIGRNDPCPCGSGKKYKKCCGKNA